MVALHTANSYHEDDGTLVLETQRYSNNESNPFAAVLFEKLNDINKIVDQKYGSKFQKISFNLKNGTLKIEDYMSADNGSLDLPMFNPKYSGVKNCFTYLSHYFGPKTVDENYSFLIHKYDSCKRKLVATFNAKSTLA